MNLILFEPAEISRPLSRSDRRAVHILTILGRKPSDTFDVGVINGQRGKGTLDAITEEALVISFRWEETPAEEHFPILIVGMPRPQTARDILRDATSLGVAEIHFVRCGKSDPSYAQSSLWSTGEWRRHLTTGAEQAFATRIPTITFTGELEETLRALPLSANRVALDNYESRSSLGAFTVQERASIAVAIGSERGWSPNDRTTLRAHRFTLAHLGPRVLRTETAVVASLSILRAKLGLM